MKSLFHVLAILALSALGIHARTWKSADGKSWFEGELIEYDAGTGQVTVDRDVSWYQSPQCNIFCL